MSEAYAVEHNGDRCVVSGTLDFTTARAALESLSALLKGTSQLHVDMGGVIRCNSAALSLMIELTGMARRQGTVITFSDVPDGLMQLAKVCQVDGYIH